MVQRYALAVAGFSVLFCGGCREVAPDLVKEAERAMERRAHPEIGGAVTERVLADDALKIKIRARIRECAIEGVKEAAKNVVKESLEAAAEAFDEPGITLQAVEGAADKSAAKSADREGAGLTAAFFGCAVTRPVMRAYSLCSNQGSGCFRAHLFSE